MRKFWLTNSNSQTIDLTSLSSSSFLESPSGLGYSKSVSTFRYNDVLKKTKEEYNYPQVQGTIVFYKDDTNGKYNAYRNFVNFLMFEPIVLHYKPVNTEYTIDVEVTQVSKGEISSRDFLEIGIVMSGLSFWKGTDVTQTVTLANTSNQVDFQINNPSDMPVGFWLMINGSDMQQPSYKLSNSTNELQGMGKFLGTFDSLYVNSKDGEQEVELIQDNAIIPNPMAYQDLSISSGATYVTFVKLVRGVNNIRLEAENTSITAYTYTYTPLYRSV